VSDHGVADDEALVGDGTEDGLRRRASGPHARARGLGHRHAARRAQGCDGESLAKLAPSAPDAPRPAFARMTASDALSIRAVTPDARDRAAIQPQARAQPMTVRGMA